MKLTSLEIILNVFKCLTVSLPTIILTLVTPLLLISVSIPLSIRYAVRCAHFPDPEEDEVCSSSSEDRCTSGSKYIRDTEPFVCNYIRMHNVGAFYETK